MIPLSLVLITNISNAVDRKNFECGAKELEQFSYGQGFDEIDAGNESFDTRKRYCFAEALIKTIDEAFLRPVARLKPETSQWIEGEWYSGVPQRQIAVLNDKDFWRWKYFAYLDPLRKQLKLVQSVQSLQTPEWEFSNWVWVLYRLNADDWGMILDQMYQRNNLRHYPENKAIKPFEFRINLTDVERNILINFIIPLMQSGDVEILGRAPSINAPKQ